MTLVGPLQNEQVSSANAWRYEHWTSDSWEYDTEWTNDSCKCMKVWTSDSWEYVTEWTSVFCKCMKVWTSDSWEYGTEWTSVFCKCMKVWTRYTWEYVTGVVTLLFILQLYFANLGKATSIDYIVRVSVCLCSCNYLYPHSWAGSCLLPGNFRKKQTRLERQMLFKNYLVFWKICI